MGRLLIFKFCNNKKGGKWINYFTETLKQWDPGIDDILTINNLTVFWSYNPSYVIPQSSLKQNPSGPTGPVTVWHACCTRLPLRCKCWGYERGHRGAARQSPIGKRSQVKRTESNWSRAQTYCANNLWLIQRSFEIKMKREDTWRAISLNSVAFSMCPVFHRDLRFSVLSRVYT